MAPAWQRDPKDREAGLINFFLSEMDNAGLFPPGQAFHYADTNYILLGMLIEQITGRSLHAELRDSIFSPLGMQHTYLSYAPDPGCPSPRPAAGGFLGRRHAGHFKRTRHLLRLGRWRCRDHAADLNHFLRGLQHGKVFRHAASRDEMLRCVDTHPDAMGAMASAYAASIRILDRCGDTWVRGGRRCSCSRSTTSPSPAPWTACSTMRRCRPWCSAR